MSSESEFFVDLDAPIKSFRIYAIEWSISSGSSEEVLSKLSERFSHEKDDECRLLLQYALEAVRARLRQAPAPEISQKSFEIEKAPEVFASGTVQEKMAFFRAFPSDSLAGFSTTAADWLQSEPHPAVASKIIQLFAKKWPREKLGILSEKLFSPFTSVRLAALDALISLSPEALLNDLPRLLTSEDPGIRSLAVRGLSKIDQDEALKHLEALLIGSDFSLKRSGIQNCLLMPFDLVKSLLLKFFSAEQDLRLLKRVGLLFQINPDLEVPYRLWEISEDSSKEKSELVKKVIQGACKAIQGGGLLREDFPEYIQRLQEWIHLRMVTQDVQKCITNLGDSDETTRLDARLEITKKLQNQEFHSAFIKALDWPLSDEIKKIIQTLITPLTSSSSSKPDLGAPPTPPIENEEADFFKLPTQEKIRKVAKFRPEQRESAKIIICAIFQDYKSPFDLRATALRSALKLELPDFSDISFPWVHNSNPNLASSALEYQAHFRPDNVFPLLGKLLKMPNPRLKSTAIKILRQYDQPQAISSLMAMLNSIDPKSRQLAMTCCIFFDFSLLREPLTELLCSIRGRAIALSFLCLFEANPDPENLYCLFRIEKALLPGDAELAKNVRKKCEAILCEYRRLSTGDLQKNEAQFEERWRKENSKKSVRPAYSLKATYPQSTEVSFFESCAEFIQPNKAPILVVFSLGILTLIMVWFLYPQKSDELANSASGKHVTFPTYYVPDVATYPLSGPGQKVELLLPSGSKRPPRKKAENVIK